jgi:hypothetical protein
MRPAPPLHVKLITIIKQIHPDLFALRSGLAGNCCPMPARFLTDCAGFCTISPARFNAGTTDYLLFLLGELINEN